MPHLLQLFAPLCIIIVLCSCEFEFNNLEVVRDISLDVLDEHNCGCIVVLRPTNGTHGQQRFIDRLTFALARGEAGGRGQGQTQVMSYVLEEYVGYYTFRAKGVSGSCFRWLCVVMACDSTRYQLAELALLPAFSQSLVLLFVNGSLSRHVEDLFLSLSSAVLAVQPGHDAGFSLVEVYQVHAHLRQTFKLQGEWHNEQSWPMTSLTHGEAGKSLILDGYFARIWLELEIWLNFKSHYIRSVDGFVGYEHEKGVWAGIIGMAQRGEVDAILSNMDIAESRMEIVEHALPILYTRLQVFTKGEGYLLEWNAVLRPFAPWVWFTLLAWIVLGGLLLCLSTTIAFHFANSDVRPVPFFHAALFIVQTLCYQGNSNVPSTSAGRIFFLTAYLTAAIIIPSFSASLISSLTKRTPVLPFETLKGILQTDYKLLIHEQSSYEFLAKSTDPEMLDLVATRSYNTSSGVMETKKPDKSGYEASLSLLCRQSKLAIFGKEGKILARLREAKVPCNVNKLNHPVAYVYQSLAFPKLSPYRGFINSRILRMYESGILSRYERMFLSRSPDPPPKLDNPVGLAHVAEIFLFLAAMAVFSACILCIERQRKHVKQLPTTIKRSGG